jgi:hypothetical protein
LWFLSTGLAKAKLEDTQSSVLVVALLALMNAIALHFPDNFRHVFTVSVRGGGLSL